MLMLSSTKPFITCRRPFTPAGGHLHTLISPSPTGTAVATATTLPSSRRILPRLTSFPPPGKTSPTPPGRLSVPPQVSFIVMKIVQKPRWRLLIVKKKKEKRSMIFYLPFPDFSPLNTLFFATFVVDDIDMRIIRQTDPDQYLSASLHLYMSISWLFLSIVQILQNLS
ncbi:hypothetical protein Tsubulata_014593 [Turnera subulata]|uniref:Uncharacterized protein n=1 Tax=Turnera subulata TaxID=218843 RepID=A0A9Q0G8T7_9ROSI|nr:hypothetical protein Tsubulata_014593 [Turnera subulata]